MEYIKVIFGADYSGKQVRYFERNMNNGESLVDKHAKKYPNPENVEGGVVSAREKYCALLGAENAPKVKQRSCVFAW